jgi:hypothetical protein
MSSVTSKNIRPIACWRIKWEWSTFWPENTIKYASPGRSVRTGSGRKSPEKSEDIPVRNTASMIRWFRSFPAGYVDFPRRFRQGSACFRRPECSIWEIDVLNDILEIFLDWSELFRGLTSKSHLYSRIYRRNRWKIGKKRYWQISKIRLVFRVLL